MMSLSDDKQADIIGDFNTTSRYLGDILNINTVLLDNMVNKLQSSQRNTLHTCAHELHMGCTTGELPLSDELHTSLKP